eukprot:158785-Rhodomonas_salina.2
MEIYGDEVAYALPTTRALYQLLDCEDRLPTRQSRPARVLRAHVGTHQVYDLLSPEKKKLIPREVVPNAPAAIKCLSRMLCTRPVGPCL